MPSGNAPLTSYLSQGTLSNYEPSWRDRAAYWLAQNWYGDNREGVQKANRLMNVADVTPVGIPLALDDAARSFGRGNYAGGAVTLAMAGIPAVRKEAKLTGEAAKKTLDAILEKHGLTQPKTIKAYHGSPHSFDKFDMSKIDTGEGAQAYGHGLYFAENEGVAKNYRDALSGNAQIALDGKHLPWDQIPNSYEGMGIKRYRDHRGNVDAALKELKEWNLPEAAGWLKKNQKRLSIIDSPGSMYEVQINADPDDFLDWDKPLSEQGAAIERLKASKSKTMQSILSDPNLLAASRDVYGTDIGPMTGQDLFKRAALDTTGKVTGGPKTIKAFAKAGIPGIKYLDQGSRVQGRFSQQLDDLRNKLAVAESKLAEATNRGRRHSAMVHSKEVDDLRNKIALAEKPQSHNYVVFDDRLITILRKYGLLPPIAAGAAYGASQDQQQPAY